VNISLATRLSLVALVVTLLSLAVTAAVGLVRGSDLADDLADDRLVTVAASRGDLVQIYVTSVRRELAALSASPGTRTAIEELGDAYAELAGQSPSPEATDRLTQYYLADVVPDLERVRGPGVSPSFLVPDGAAGIYLQDAYVVPKANEDGSSIGPVLVLDAGDGSTYSALHPEIHQTFGGIGLQSGFDDLLLIDARSDVVVYSVQKRTDFATSLDAGPQSGSSLARLIDQIRDDPDGGSRLADFAAYVPAGDEATAFVAAPVFGDDGRIVGYVAAALSIDPFDALVSGDGDWDGFGQAGEAYIVGGDGTMRTTSRAFATDSQVYLANTTDEGPAALTDEQRRRMSATGTTALVEEVDRRALATAEAGDGVGDTVSYRGIETRTAFRPLDIDDVDWVMFGEVPRDDLDGPIEDYARNMLLAVALFVVAVTFVAVRWSNRLMAPIRVIAARLRAVRSGDVPPAADQAVPASGPIEYEELSANVDQMLLRLRQRQDAVDARSAERTELLRQFLPAAVARRTEEGDGDVLDHVRNASVVVLTVDGVGDLVADRPESEVRTLLGEIIDETDALAADLGLERIKLTGATYYAVCGATRPYLDHAPRTVAFALAARDLVDEIGGGRLSVRGGVASGSFSVGLAARGGLVYDAWGDTVAAATRLAGRAPRGGVAASAAVAGQLPDEFVVAGDADDGVVVVTGRVERSEAAT
jgi:class 3 adenylate cyclase